LENDAGGVLLQMFFQRHFQCREQTTFLVSMDFNSDIYEVFKGFTISNMPGLYYAC
jgi:hypothetical protein